MATNSVLNQGLAPQFVAAETLRTLVPVLQPIKEIAVTDFSSYVDRIGNVVHTRLASPLTAASYDPTVGFVEQSAVAADIPVQLTTQTYVDIAFTDLEQGSISAEMLQRVFLAPMTESVASRCSTTCLLFAPLATSPMSVIRAQPLRSIVRAVSFQSSRN